MALSVRNVGLFVAAAVPIIGVVAGGIWGTLTYLHGKRLEYQKAFNDKQLEIVMLTAQTVGDLVAIETEDEWKHARERFWELYWGRLVLFEDDSVVKVMVALGDHLNNLPFDHRGEITRDSYNVSLALRNFLAKKNDEDWRISFAVLNERK